MTSVQTWEAERRGRDREDKPDYKLKIGAGILFFKQCQCSGILS